MALKSAGFEDVLLAIKNNGATVRLYGKESQDGFLSEQDWESNQNLGITWLLGSPDPISDSSWKLEMDSSSPITFNVDTSNSDVRVQGVRLLDSGSQVLLEQTFSQTYEYTVDGDFTLTSLVVTASS